MGVRGGFRWPFTCINTCGCNQVLREVKLEKCADTIVGGTDPIYMKKVGPYGPEHCRPSAHMTTSEA